MLYKGNLLCPYCGKNAQGEKTEDSVKSQCLESDCGKEFSGSKEYYEGLVIIATAFVEEVACPTCGTKVRGPNFCQECGCQVRDYPTPQGLVTRLAVET